MRVQNQNPDPSAGGGGGGGGGPAGGGAPWYGQLPADAPKEFTEWLGAKGFKDPHSALTSAWNTEKLVGAPADQIIRLPKADDKAGWDGVWGRLGRPEKPEGYELPLPQGDDGAFAKTAAGWFHANGVPKAAAQAIAKQWNDHISKLVEDGRKADEQKANQALEALKGEWGNEFDKRSEFGRRGLKAYGEKAGLDANDLTALEQSIGTAKMLKLFHQMGETTGEHGFGSGPGGGGPGNVSPAQARTQLDEARAQRIEGKLSEKQWLEISERLGPIASRT
jgi:hypothetical protein